MGTDGVSCFGFCVISWSILPSEPVSAVTKEKVPNRPASKEIERNLRNVAVDWNWNGHLTYELFEVVHVKRRLVLSVSKRSCDRWLFCKWYKKELATQRWTCRQTKQNPPCVCINVFPLQIDQCWNAVLSLWIEFEITLWKKTLAHYWIETNKKEKKKQTLVSSS